MILKDFLIYLSSYIGLFAVTFYVLCFFSRAKEKPPEFPEKNPPFVSIIIPAWNEEKGIAGSIKNALELDYPKDKLEIIIVDDGSTDNTYKIASQFNGDKVRVYKLEKNSGKGEAVNFGIKKAKGEIIVTMDADNTHPQKDALKYMVAYFNNPEVMCVAPAMAIYHPKGILQRIQQVEYLLGVFLRKAFASINAIHITPGAFSAYRKFFFEKHGGFVNGHLTEDLEMALRIQKNFYTIENSTDAIVFVVAPKKFTTLMKQRKRWYTGLLRNLWDYKFLFSKKYGSMGVIVLPVAIITIILSTILTSYIIINSLLQLKKEILLLESINFNVLSSFEFNKYVLERYLFLIFSNPTSLIFIIFIGILIGYMVFAKRRVKQHADIKLSIIFFSIFYSFLFAFWWIMSFLYTLFHREVSWR